MTADLADRIRSALDEIERIARTATPGPWVARRYGVDTQVWSLTEDRVVMNGGPAGDVTRRSAEHIARHDPAAVLRRVAAERRVLERHAPQSDVCAWCPVVPWPCPDITDLADRLGINTEESR